MLTEGEAPRKARGSLIGVVNDREFGVSFLEANITENPEEGTSTMQAHLDNIPPSVGECERCLTVTSRILSEAHLNAKIKHLL